MTAGTNLTSINDNFTTIEAELNDKVLYRDNPVGETNTVQQDIDMNSNKIINATDPTNAQDVVTKNYVDGLAGFSSAAGLAQAVIDAQTAQTAAETAQTAAELAETNAETAETNAETAETNAETAETNAAASAVSAAASAASVTGGGGTEEGIINGALNVAQELKSITAAATNSYIVDMFRYIKTGTMVHTVSQDTDVPTFGQAGVVLSNSILVDCTTADVALGTSDFCGIKYTAPGDHTANFSQKEVTLQFWVKATETGTYSGAFKSNANVEGNPFEYTVNAVDTWEKKTVTETLDPATVFNTDENEGLSVVWSLGHGSSFNGTAGAWALGNLLGTANQVNAVDNTANNFRLAGISIRVGTNTDNITSYLPFNETLSAVQRFYNKSYDYDVDPATASALGALSAFTENAGDTLTHYSLPTEMRDNPTITFYNSATGVSGGMDEVDGGTDLTSQVATSIGTTGFEFSRVGGASNNRYRFQYEADSRYTS